MWRGAAADLRSGAHRVATSVVIVDDGDIDNVPLRRHRRGRQVDQGFHEADRRTTSHLRALFLCHA